jgi:hypothetical protein
MSSAVPVSPSGKRPLLRVSVAGLLVLAVLLAAVRPGGGVPVAAAGPPLVRAPVPAPEPPRKDEPRKEDPKQEAAAKEKAGKQPGAGEGEFPDFDEMFKRMVPPGIPPEQVKQMEAQMRRSMDMARMMMARNGQGMVMPFGHPEASRLGVRVEKPGETLIEQLDLPRGQGLVMREVETDSAAAKAGIKAHDVLLEVNGKPVPDEPREMARQLDRIKADTPVDAVVLRKGKRETVKGLTLPEAKPAEAPFPNFNFPAPPQGLLPAVPPPLMPGLQNMGLGGGGVLTTTQRTADRFTTRHQEGSLIITVTGTVADGKIKVGAIHVQDGTSTQRFDSADKVPEQYRDKLKDLLEICEKSARITVQP